METFELQAVITYVFNPELSQRPVDDTFVMRSKIYADISF